METNIINLFAFPAVILLILELLSVLMPCSRYAYWLDENEHWFGIIILCMLFLACIISFC